LAERVTGKPPNVKRIDLLTQSTLYLTTVLSLYLQFNGVDS